VGVYGEYLPPHPQGAPLLREGGELEIICPSGAIKYKMI